MRLKGPSAKYMYLDKWKLLRYDISDPILAIPQEKHPHWPTVRFVTLISSDENNESDTKWLAKNEMINNSDTWLVKMQEKMNKFAINSIEKQRECTHLNFTFIKLILFWISNGFWQCKFH